MKYYVLFTETYPDGIVIKENEITDYKNDDGYVYEIGQRITDIQSFIDFNKGK